MGSFLDKPVTQHHTYEGEDKNGLRAALACMQGWRVDMEVRSGFAAQLGHMPSLLTGMLVLLPSRYVGAQPTRGADNAADSGRLPLFAHTPCAPLARCGEGEVVAGAL